MVASRPSAAARYVAAIALSVVALLIRKLVPVPPGIAIYPFAFAAVMLGAWYGGRGPGLAGLATCAVGAAYFFIPPVGTFQIGWEYALGLLTFVVVGAFMVQFITVRQVIEARLRASEEMWRAAFENNPTMFFMVDALGKVMSVNPVGAAQLGYSVHELAGRSVLDVVYERDRETVSRIFAECIARPGETTRGELRKVRKDGTVIWVRESARAVRGPKHETTILLACEDITDARRAEEALAESRSELAHVTHATTMGELAASIAHEVNQPLSAIVANASASLRWLAREPPEIAEARQATTHIIADATRAAALIERVRASTRKFRWRKEVLDLNDVFREAVALTRAETQRGGVSVEMDLSTAVPRVVGDRIQLQQVALNLIMNGIEAIGRTADGPRSLVIRSGSHGPDGVLVTVADSGPGLEPAAVERVFDAFYTTKPHGMGMGLAISRSIIESHGGRIWASANSPRGAAFHFTLPASREGVAQETQRSLA
jgi:PAS domain S-box-containing protein